MQRIFVEPSHGKIDAVSSALTHTSARGWTGPPMGPAARAALAARRASSAFASAPPRRAFSSGPSRAPPAGLLLRDFLHRALTDRAAGYFAQPDAPVGRIRDPIDFPSLLGQEDYARALDARYARLSSQWLTPVEIFQPHYARAVAAYILREHLASHPDRPLRVYELGGGTGTCASNFLAHVRDAAPDVYARMSYVSVEVSRTLADAQRRAVRATLRRDEPESSSRPNGPKTRATHLKPKPKGGNPTTAPHRVEVRDATDRAGWGAVDRAPCFVVALEVLDNLPHDRVARGDDGAWTQTRVAADAAGVPFEYVEPLADPLIRRVAAVTGASGDQPSGERGLLDAVRRAFEVATGRSDVAFVPTGAARLLDALHDARPNHRLVAADFDALPGVRLEGANAPIVASQAPGGKTIDRDTYLEDPGRADVFFPTDFRALARLDADARGDGEGGRGRVMTTRAFMEANAVDLRATETASGYNPLLQDFSNTRFYLS